MKVRSRDKLLAAAMAVAFSGAANAAIDPDQIVLYVSNGGNSAMFDLGINLSNFLTSNTGPIVWNLSSSSVTGTPGSSTLGYGNVYSTFTFGANTVWGVIGADVIEGDIVTTSLAPADIVDNMTGTQMTIASADVPGVYLNQNNGVDDTVLGQINTHTTNDNGASYVTDSTSSALHANGFGAFDDWRSQSPFSASRVGNGSIAVYRLAYNEPTGTLGGLRGSGQYAGGTFTLDWAAGTLTYGAVPEPTSVALVVGGIAGLGAFVRRRKSA